MALQIKLALTTAGCKIDPGAFKLLVKRVFLKRFPRHTDADVYLNPEKDAKFCGCVRAEANSPDLPAYLINRVLEGLRKQGQLPQTRNWKKTPGRKSAQVHARPATRTGAKGIGTEAVSMAVQP
jgi:hypothetical protein